MPLEPLLPLFHRLNREHFDGCLVRGTGPLVALRWSDGRMRKTAGFYRRGPAVAPPLGREIVLSKPLLVPLPRGATESTLCHEMIHAWVDLVLGQRESHGPCFRAQMEVINASQTRFKVSIRHRFLFSRVPLVGLPSAPSVGSGLRIGDGSGKRLAGCAVIGIMTVTGM